MFEKISQKFGTEKVHTPKEVIVPVEGLEDKPFSLPEIDEDGNHIEPHDDWLLIGERATDNATLVVDLARYKEDGSIEYRLDLPADLFENFQLQREADLRFREARQDLGISAVRASIVKLVRDSDTYAQWQPIEEAALAEIAKTRRERVEESRQFMQGYNKTIPKIDSARDPRVRHPRH